MTSETVLNKLLEKEIIPPEQAIAISDYENRKPFSIHWELRSVLYIGILLFTSGLGVIIYQNIDTIGHQVIIALIALLTAGCFYYCFQKKQPFSWQEVKNPDKLGDYILLLGCTAFLILEGYLQFQYKAFGTKYGLAVFIPTIVFFFCAYYFDHRGILSMAITGLASWLGLTIAPLSLLSGNDFTDIKLVVTALVLGFILITIGWLTNERDIKKHFSFTYVFLGGNLAAIAAMIGMFDQEINILYFVTAAGLSAFFIFYARQKQQLIFLLMGTVYGYIVFTYMLFKILPDDLLAGLSVHYFLVTSIGVIFFLLNVKKILRIKK